MKDLFITYPDEISSDENLTTTERFLLLLIIALDNEKGCFAHNKTLAEYLNCSVGTISTSISSLLKRGYITSNVERPGAGGRGHTRTVKESLRKRKSEIKDKNASHSKIETHTLNNGRRINNKIKVKNDNTSYSIRRFLTEINVNDKIDLFQSCKESFSEKFNGNWTDEEHQILADLIKSALTMINKRKFDFALEDEMKAPMIKDIIKEILSKPPKYLTDFTPKTYYKFWNKIVSQPSVNDLISGFKYKYGGADENFF